jgi:hypothetical protein
MFGRRQGVGAMNEPMAVVVVVGIVTLIALGFVLGSHAGGPPPGPKATSRRPEAAARSGRRKSSGDIPGSGLAGADGDTSCDWGSGDSGGGDGGGGSC